MHTYISSLSFCSSIMVNRRIVRVLLGISIRHRDMEYVMLIVKDSTDSHESCRLVTRDVTKGTICHRSQDSRRIYDSHENFFEWVPFIVCLSLCSRYNRSRKCHARLEVMTCRGTSSQCYYFYSWFPRLPQLPRLAGASCIFDSSGLVTID